jgi:hypothetical protein
MNISVKPTSNDLLKAIGDLSVVFSGLEMDLIRCLCFLVNRADLSVGQAIADRLNFQNTVNLISDLVNSHLPDSAAKEFRIIATEARAAASKRNDILHSNWVFAMEADVGDVDVLQERPRHRDRAKDLYEAADLMKQLRDAAKQVFVVAMKVQKFTRQYFEK